MSGYHNNVNYSYILNNTSPAFPLSRPRPSIRQWYHVWTTACRKSRQLIRGATNWRSNIWSVGAYIYDDEHITYNFGTRLFGMATVQWYWYVHIWKRCSSPSTSLWHAQVPLGVPERQPSAQGVCKTNLRSFNNMYWYFYLRHVRSRGRGTKLFHFSSLSSIPSF